MHAFERLSFYSLGEAIYRILFAYYFEIKHLILNDAVMLLLSEKVKPKIVAFIPAVLWLTVSIVLLVIPGSDIPQAPFFEIIYFDKWVHIGMFGLLMLLWCFPFLKEGLRAKNLFIIIGICVITYGVLMEFIQRYFVKDRSFDVTDIIADTAGVLIVWFWLTYKLKNQKAKKVYK